MMRSRAVEAAAGSEAVEAFTAAVAELAAATGAGRARHIPSQAALGVPDIQLPVVPVVQATQSRAEGIIEDMGTVRRR